MDAQGCFDLMDRVKVLGFKALHGDGPFLGKEVS
jgi:hypothetical protein